MKICTSSNLKVLSSCLRLFSTNKICFRFCSSFELRPRRETTALRACWGLNITSHWFLGIPRHGGWKFPYFFLGNYIVWIFLCLYACIYPNLVLNNFETSLIHPCSAALWRYSVAPLGDYFTRGRGGGAGGQERYLISFPKSNTGWNISMGNV